MFSRAARTTSAIVDRYCVTNLVFHCHIKILKLWHAHACASIDIKFFNGIVIVSFISIYITHPCIVCDKAVDVYIELEIRIRNCLAIH